MRLYLFAVGLTAALVLSCNRPPTVKSNDTQDTTSKRHLGKWYFAWMDGYGDPFAQLDFVNDSLVVEDTKKIPYTRRGDSIRFVYPMGEQVSKLSYAYDSLVITEEGGAMYYCRTPFRWDQSDLARKLLGIWWSVSDTSAPTAAMQIEEGAVLYPDPMYSARASFRGNLLAIEDRNGSRVDTVAMNSNDTLILSTEYGVDTLYRGKD